MVSTSRSVLAVIAASALVLAACTPDKEQVTPDPADSPTSSASTSETPQADGDVYSQQIEWETCGWLECATIQVPVDWADPEGDTMDLEINRLVAASTTNRIGSLLINPGGPGGSGLDFTEYFVTSAGDDLLSAYDVIGFDPRGVGQSTPVMCGSDSVIDDYYLPDYPLESQEDLDAGVARNEVFAQECFDASGPVVENVDTASAARDMDLIRALVGDEKLQYIGFSYGTQLGATYAELFPENVGRLVLDGAVDFLLPGDEQSIGQAEGFEQALTNFLVWCDGQQDCALEGDVEQKRQQISDLMADALADPFYTGEAWDLNGNLMVYGIVVTLYDEASWTLLNSALAELVEAGTAGIMYQLANFYLDRDGATGEYSANSTWVFTAIGCLDAGQDDAWTFDDVEDFRALMNEASPTFGWWFANSAGCDGWPWEADTIVTSLDNAASAPQMLVIGTTNDPATPYAWAESLSERLGASLLTYDGEGHTAYGRSNQCIIDNVDGFLVDGQMPDSGTQC
ncbi:alpha/beta hydrolase [Demequina sp. B12]|uniref:alpha/beta hydrolase n=1 Tax=Demequina sp. B12 TaxID=2992757 RepID=UPI00237B5644|nr:alpha/beta hydrolase [Demequina sp. B12]MDE0571817.1 alpha/beta hydrolase [Demequina sp. B12]